MSDAEARAIQRFYPQIYFACHVDHVRQSSTLHGLSSRDSGILSHLDEAKALAPSTLARHIGVGAPTLSAHLERLVRLGYVARNRSPLDGRQWELRLTPKGARAMAATSVLDARQVARVLARLSSAERKRAVEGMGLLAEAARTMSPEWRKPR